MKHKVTIEETLSLTVEVEADSAAGAISQVEDDYNAEVHVLSAEQFVGVDIFLSNDDDEAKAALKNHDFVSFVEESFNNMSQDIPLDDKIKLAFGSMDNALYEFKEHQKALSENDMRKFRKGQKVYWIDPAGETSGEYELCRAIEIEDEDSDSIILIGNEHSEAEVFLHELIFINEALPAKMQEAFDEYIKYNGKEPNVADCRISWLDDGNSCDVNFQLSVDSNPETDDTIFFYCDGLSDLQSFTKPGGEDFIITDFYHFE